MNYGNPSHHFVFLFSFSKSENYGNQSLVQKLDGWIIIPYIYIKDQTRDNIGLQSPMINHMNTSIEYNIDH